MSRQSAIVKRMISKFSREVRETRGRRRAGVLAGAVLALTTLSAVAAPAMAEEQVTITQGQKIVATDGTACSVGYVEPARAWTSAHCGLDGGQIYTEWGQHVGTLRWFSPSGAAGHDLAYVQFAGGTLPGGNPLTGDGMAPPPADGTSVCIDGRYSGRHCGQAVHGPGVFPGMHYAVGMPTSPGDSGGPVSVAGRPGVVGIYQGITEVNRNGQHLTFSNYARVPNADELAKLPHQGFVPRRPNREPGNPIREAQERGEALSSTSSKGFDGLRGLAVYFGLPV